MNRQLSAQTLRDPEIQRSKAVAVRVELLQDSAAQGSGRFALELFDDERIVTYEDSHATAAGGLVWTGRIEGADWSAVNFVAHGNAVAASIRYDHELLRICPDAGGNGVHALTLLDEDRFAPCGTTDRHVVYGPSAAGIESSVAGRQPTCSWPIRPRLAPATEVPTECCP